MEKHGRKEDSIKTYTLSLDKSLGISKKLEVNL